MAKNYLPRFFQHGNQRHFIVHYQQHPPIETVVYQQKIESKSKCKKALEFLFFVWYDVWQSGKEMRIPPIIILRFPVLI